LSRLFRTKAFRTWKELDESRAAALEQASNATTGAKVLAEEQKRLAQNAPYAKQKADQNLQVAVSRLEKTSRVVREARDRIGSRFIDDQFFEHEHDERHRVAPWLDGVAQRNRDDVFVAAMKLHKAFVDSAAKPLRHNLGALMNVLSGRSLSTTEKEALLPDLWASLFLVVPVVSTTFASVERMLGRLPPESLGWLLVDEAGQALPQAAVGAIMRTRRAVVVGDPIQIEPVVTLPDTLTDTICRKFGVDPDRFNAPACSVQTLADSATSYMAEFEGQYGSRTVGVPLLVHRRCAQPMFGISNVVAYGRLMVNAKQPGRSAIRDLLGPSQWINVQGVAEEKWCPQEGEVVIKLLQEMARADIDNPDLYIVTPFVIVQDHLRKPITGNGLLKRWTDKPWDWARERVGTVHTVQGREAETVFFVLGAPAHTQTGARGWAGGKPNLLNVAVSRAKEALYVVGNRQLWREAGLFKELHARLPNAD
jgi:AAA domain